MNDSIHPRVSGNASLYTVDYFRDCRRRLAPGGFMSSWFPVYGMRPEELRMILRSFQTVFPHATLWMAHNVVNRHALLLAPAGDAPLTIDYRDFLRRFLKPEIQADLAAVDMDDPLFFLSSLVMNEDALRDFSSGADLNTDDHPLLEYRVPKHVANDELAWAAILEAMIPYRSDVRELLVDLPEDAAERKVVEDSLGRFFQSNEYVLRGMVKGLRGDPTSPEEFSTARSLCPGHPAVRIAEARQESQLDERIRQAEARPTDPRAHIELGHAYRRMGRLEEAVGEMEAAARLDPGNADVPVWLGELWMSRGEPRRAIDAFRRALEKRPDHVEALVGLAAALETVGDAEEAARRYREAADLGARGSEIRIKLGILEESLGHAEDAAAAYRDALRVSPLAVEALNNLALIEAERGHEEEAETLLRRAMEAEPRDPDAWNNLAWHYAERGDHLDEALEMAGKAVELDPSVYTYDTMAWVRFRRGELAPAREAALKALELDPTMDACREHLRAIDEALKAAPGGEAASSG